MQPLRFQSIHRFIAHNMLDISGSQPFSTHMEHGARLFASQRVHDADHGDHYVGLGVEGSDVYRLGRYLEVTPQVEDPEKLDNAALSQISAAIHQQYRLSLFEAISNFMNTLDANQINDHDLTRQG